MKHWWSRRDRAANDAPLPAEAAAAGTERALRRLEWTVIRRLDGLLQGDYRTLMRGTGLDLADLREYQHHDDVRHIDWNVTARLQVPHVRVFTEDREMAAWFVLDLSRSVDFGSGTRAKREISAGFVGVVARLLTRHGNRVGALVYGSELEAVIPPRTGRRHVLHLLHAMERRGDVPKDKGAGGTTRLAELLDAAGTFVRRRSTVFVVSDFLSEPGWERPLGQLAMRHEVVAVRLFDPLELELPDLGLVPLTDAETGDQVWVDTHDGGFRKRFARLAREREDGLREALARAGVDALELSTNDDLVEAIVRFADLRKRRVRNGLAGAKSGGRIMNFLWPQFLWLLLTVPFLLLLYVWLLRRKKKLAIRYASLSIVREAMGAGQTVRRHIPPFLFLLAMVAMLVAAARPMAVVTLPSNQQTIILAMDVSGSMRAADVQPNRLAAAQTAAKSFLKDLPRNVKVGVVAFAGSAQVAQLPTVNRDDLVTAIDSFQLQRGTATGNGLVVALATLFPDAGIDIDDFGPKMRQRAVPIEQAGKDAKKEFVPVPPGSYTSAAIIMLTDGQRTTGVDPLDAAKMAADRGVRVYTVGVGTVDGETIGFEGWSMRVRLDEETLKSIANKTQAEYFYAGTAADLKKVYDTLSSRLTVEKKETEISALFALGAAALALLSAALSLLWFNRIL